jgi:protein-S-isoprenylcysteine O-methyltransferase Ste14
MSEKVDAELVTTGPYRLVRHPIYSGLIAALIGAALAVAPILLIGVALVGGYFVRSATAEERTMLRLFADRYASYQQCTRMMCRSCPEARAMPECSFVARRDGGSSRPLAVGR